MKKKLLLILAILFTATSIFAMKIYLTNSAGSGQAQADPNASLGGYRSTTELSATSMKNLFDDVSIVEALLGDTEYRMIDIYNDAATDALRVQFYSRTPTSSPDTALTYGYSATAQPHADSWNGEALANESTAPASPSMSFVDSTKTSPLALGTIPAGSSARVCVKRVVSAGSAWTTHDIGSFGVRWGGVAAAGDTYTDLLFFWRCEDVTLGADDYSAGDTTATASGAAAINTDAVKVGTNGGDFPTQQDYYGFTATDLISTAEGRFGTWIYVNSHTDTAAADIFALKGSTTDYIYLEVAGGTGSADLDLSFKWKDNNSARTAFAPNTNLSSGTWYFIEYAWKASTDYREIFVDGVSAGTSSAAFGEFQNTPDVFSIGVYDASGMDCYMDNVMISNSSTRDLNALKNLTASPR